MSNAPPFAKTAGPPVSHLPPAKLSMLDGIFQFLFKYRPTEFANGDLAFGAPFSVVDLLLAAAAIGIPAVLSYAGVRGKSSRRDRWVLGALRVAALGGARRLPVPADAAAVRGGAAAQLCRRVGRRFAEHADRRPRRKAAQRLGRARVRRAGQRAPQGAPQKFIVRLFRFSSATQRIDSAADLTFDAAETHLGTAIEQASQELDAVPLSGLVVLSDGADNSRAPIGDELLAAREVGADLRRRTRPSKFDKDIEIKRVEAAHSVLKGGALVADLLVRSSTATRVSGAARRGGRSAASSRAIRSRCPRTTTCRRCA